MALKDLALTRSGDLFINEKGDFEIINSVRQAVSIKLRWIKGEWIFNQALGTPYFESILVKKPNNALIEKLIKDQILSVDGIISVSAISLVNDHASRTLTVKFTARTLEEEIESEVEISRVGSWNNI